MNETVGIHINRKLFGLAALGFGVVGVGIVSREISAGSVGVAAIIVTLFGGFFAYYVRGFMRRGPVLVIDADGLSGSRVGCAIRWTSAGDIHLKERQGSFGIYHHLIVTVRREDQPQVEDAVGLLTSRIPIETVEFSIDQLSMPWSEIVTLVQERLGRNVSKKRETWLSAIQTRPRAGRRD
ncbi:MAG TPA: hypothetical protein VLJ42_12545 [Solirubrobacteraceae bacterium]|nr:hypothetical protein [Solirubrobacteraceae bacterium]